MTAPRDLPFSPASERNREPIFQVLKRWLPENARVLEIGAGTGQHAVYFCRQMPGLHWQSTDLADNLPGLRARLEIEGDGIPPPLVLDVMSEKWPDGPYDAVYAANTVHIMPWDHTPVLLERSAGRLASGGLLILYGPFHDGGRHTSKSNRQFDQSLKSRDPSMGVRDALEVSRIAASCGLNPEADIAMPANNRMLMFRNGR